jgi:signal transduction histidine kinase
MEAGRAVVHPEPVDLAAALEEVVTSASPGAAERGLALSLRVAPALGTVETDGVKVRQIVLNLLSNALKFTPAGGEVKVEARRGEADWSVTVGDTGVGIAAVDQGPIFDPFRQVDGSASRRAGGTGVGLAIARKLAHLLGGEVTVDSAPGQGSRFTLTLPLVSTGRV